MSFITAALLVVVGLAPDARDLTGVVLDPHGLPVADATATLTCDGRAAVVMTDREGRFAFAPFAESACVLDIARPAFAPAHLEVRADMTQPVVVRLRMDTVSESVEVAAPAPPRAAFLSVSLSDADFRHVAGNAADLLRYAQQLAGATASRSVVYVDGLPADTLPPLDMIARVTVNADPFSAEYAEGNVTTIQLITKAPSRQFRFRTGSDAIGVGGRDPLTGGRRSESVAGSAGISGAIPRLPITFAVNAHASRLATAAPVVATLPSGISMEDDATTVSRTTSGALDLYYSPSADDRIRVSYRDLRSSGVDVGVGGLALPESGVATTSTSRDLRATVSGVMGSVTYESGAMATFATFASRANSDALGVSVAGHFIGGGSAITASRSQRVHWTLKQVVRTPSARPWSAGVVMSGADHHMVDTPNAYGLLHFDTIDAYEAATNGAPAGTLFRTQGNGRVDYAALTVAPFVQKAIVRRAAIELNAGMRADYQRGFGTIWSPRVWIGATPAGFNISAGSGVFARSIPDAVVLGSIARDGRHLRQFLATQVAMADALSPEWTRVRMVRAELDSNLVRPRELMHRVAVERVFGRFVPAVEYTWSRELHRLGAERRAEGVDWVDTTVSNRTAQQHRVHMRVRTAWRRHSVTGHYEWVHASDNSDGAFSFAERPGDLRGEWARSAGIAPHNVTITGSFALPGAVSVNVNDTWHSRTPYNITTGRDASGNGLYNDRGGRLRNSGTAPGFNTLSVYAFRRTALPDVVVPGPRTLHVNVGVQINNLLDNKNYTSIGSVAGAPSFGRPLAAYPGRSLRLFLNID